MNKFVPIINEKELLEDVAEMIGNYLDVEYEDALSVLKLPDNAWFMEQVLDEMFEAEANYITEKCNILFEKEK